MESPACKKGQNLRPHQVEGIEFLIRCFEDGHGCILADEMGLGKTCQSLAFLSHILRKNDDDDKIKYLILCPLSIIDQWNNETEKFGFDLGIIVYRGDKQTREGLRQEISSRKVSWNTILTTYEILMKDCDFFARFEWDAVVIDEAHRLKNKDSVLYSSFVNQIKYKWMLLLTGTPVQNNMNELYSLLSLCHPSEFPLKLIQKFVDRFYDVKSEKVMDKLRKVLERYVLRRTKDFICTELPTKAEIVLFHNLTKLQKELYKAILTKNYALFEQGSTERGKVRLTNVLVQLRKCVGHPYLFDGIEPEPFEQGEHLVEASGKLIILDALLSFLQKNGHKVLVYSQMTRMLDIVQDYLTYRGYTYERLDGSVRGEERFAAVQRFTDTETFCFLLSTKAGGLGLNLVAADTVIFLDSDFNPQNDLQAAARVHRMGQNRHVKIIRLVGRRTVEEIILARAGQKLKFTDAVLAETREECAKYLNASDISEMLTFGLSEMGEEEKKEAGIGDLDLKRLLGESEQGQWVAGDTEQSKWIDETAMKNIYTFEGKDYREESKQADREAFIALKDATNTLVDRSDGASTTDASVQARQKRVRTPEELEEMREKRRQAAEKRKEAEENRLAKREEEKRARLFQLWEENDYESSNLPEADDLESGDTESLDLEAVDSDSAGSTRAATCDPIFIVGDVTKPQIRAEHQNGDAIVVHCADDSGSWGKGGLFTALTSLSGDIAQRYELAKRMKDLALGDAHLIEAKKNENAPKTLVALLIAQNHKDRSELKFDAFEKALKRIGSYAAKNGCSVHMPRIGYGMASFNWYTTERMIRKVLSTSGVPTYIYYFPRNQKKRQHEQDNDGKKQGTSCEGNDSSEDSDGSQDGANASAPKRQKATEDGQSDSEEQQPVRKIRGAPQFLNGCNFYFHESVTKERLKEFLLPKLVRMLGGEVSKEPGPAVTHILVENDWSQDLKTESHQRVVTRGWLHKCVGANKLLPYE